MAGSGTSKRASDKEDNKITIGVQSQDGIKVLISVRRHVPLQKLLMKYCENKKLDYKSMRFVYKGRKLLVRATPDELRMKDGDHIDALLDGHAG